MLVVEVEYLTGVARAANDRGDAADWPPQPDRLFSALTASWAARGEIATERRALEWLEAQAPPRLIHADFEARSVVPVFVPPNDDSSSSVTILPARRRRQERRFPAAWPADPLVRFVWESDPDAATLDALDALARDTSYLGHSASVVRCRAYRETEAPADTQAARRRVYPGRLDELVGCYTGHGDKSRQVRPAPGADVRAPAAPKPAPPASVFGADWIVFAHAEEPRPDAVAGAMACKALLKTALSGYGTDPVPAWVSGHAPDGAPLTTPHLAAVPLLDAGWEHARGRLMGLALVPPRAVTEAVARARDPRAETVARADVAVLEEVTGLERALVRALEAGRLTLRLRGGLVWPLQWDTEATKQSLRPALYTGTADTWATVTPIALDRHPKKDGDAAEIIADACERIGLPRPSVVVAHKHSAHRAAPSARASSGAPPWTGWRRPESVANRRLTHAVLRFPEAVAGPVILGAGRFVGLGLCRPLPERKEPKT
ncbi:type I-G CRISPR-associated protein Csb2 [Roseospira navarrensis]|uniref:Type I-U CRISPR-associated protein Cas5/Cas6 n=1 Tax=Roseospira navarrensis TaxID=140058 RepID=A0A7X1ZHV5_9PROT|nr:type I-U CRISPR-associated protein Csb2 [Roseospira navarrensis]MQX38254.1 type I-U CRISPR-associated protein Cas5/Cas6 [Roseospira navarrensis]